MNETHSPSTAHPVTLAGDVRALQHRVRAFAGTGTMQTAPTSYHRFATHVDIELTPIDPIPEHLKDLIIELAAGATSAAAARNLHMSGRTVSRRISEIFDHLGAKSPFQAGVIAARRWLI